MASTGQHDAQQGKNNPEMGQSRARSLGTSGKGGCSLDQPQVGNAGQKQTIILHDVRSETLTV